MNFIMCKQTWLVLFHTLENGKGKLSAENAQRHRQLSCHFNQVLRFGFRRCLTGHAYRDKKVVSVFVRFRAPLWGKYI